MKFIFVFVFVVLAAVNAAPVQETITTSDAEVKEVTQTELEEREKRTLGVDENYNKVVEVKTPQGGSLKISKTISYNDGGAVVHLPTMLDSMATNKNKILEQLQKLNYKPQPAAVPVPAIAAAPQVVTYSAPVVTSGSGCSTGSKIGYRTVIPSPTYHFTNYPLVSTGYRNIQTLGSAKPAYVIPVSTFYYPRMAGLSK